MPGTIPNPVYVYRITHYNNLPFILQNGLCCRNHAIQDPHYVNIGHRSLIDLRGRRPVPIAPFGVLNDYIPFYFTKRSPMLYLIHKHNVPDYTGDQSEIIYLVTSVEKIGQANLNFVFTDRHAKLNIANFYNRVADLHDVDWNVIKSDRWNNTKSDFDRQERKQAELLVHQHVPIDVMLGIACYSDTILRIISQQIQQASLAIPTAIRRTWYY